MKTKQMHVLDNKLYMGSYSLDELANEYKTPLYVYDEVQIKDKIDKYLKGLKNNNINGEMVYASKAFICPYLCNILKDKGCYIDAVSIGDLYLMNKSKFPMEHVVLHGNNKSFEDLEYAINNNVGYIVCDNLDELDRLQTITNKLNKKVKTLFRVNPGVEAHTHKYIQTSRLDSKFGESIFDLDKIEKIMEFYSKSNNIELMGWHAHIGSQITSFDSFEVLAKVMADFILNIYNKYNFNTKILDFGGGIAIKYLDSDIEPDIEDILSKMINTVSDLLKDTNIKLEKVFVEPGRSIVGDAGITLYKVGGIKKTIADTSYIFIDGGMADNIRPALYSASYTIDNASSFEGGKKEKFNLSGKCCESGDMIVRDYKITKPKIGDTIVTYSTGAYCYSMSMNYNGLTRGAVVFIDKDKKTVVIKKETLEDLVKTCVF